MMMLWLLLLFPLAQLVPQLLLKLIYVANRGQIPSTPPQVLLILLPLL